MQMEQLKKVIETVKALRHPDHGCPWDLKQTHESLTKYMLEEAYEYVHAVEKKEKQEMCEELGDVLLQILLNSTIAEQQGKFTLEDVARSLDQKLIERHPHVFLDKKSLQAEEVAERWQEIKNKNKTEKKSYISEKELYYPSLDSAKRIGDKTAKINFDWDNPSQVAYKVEEEWQELKEELASYPKMNKDRVKEELGDLLFSLAQLARHLEISAEEALHDANKKFLKRFWKMEKLIQEAGEDIEQMNQKQMDVYWDKVKLQEKK